MADQVDPQEQSSHIGCPVRYNTKDLENAYLIEFRITTDDIKVNFHPKLNKVIVDIGTTTGSYQLEITFVEKVVKVYAEVTDDKLHLWVVKYPQNKYNLTQVLDKLTRKVEDTSIDADYELNDEEIEPITQSNKDSDKVALVK